MPALHLLGTGSAVTDAHRATTMLAVEDEDGGTILVDCGGDVYQRARLAGLDPERFDGLIITHEHPDHVSGFPLFMVRIWQAGRTRPLPVYGPAEALEQAQRLLAAFNSDSWDLPEIQWTPVRTDRKAEVLTTPHFRIEANAGAHSVPVIGLRITYLRTGFSIGYSCDTEPCASILDLVQDVDLLIHEATGDVRNHSSAQQAIEVARSAGCQQLVLVHLPVGLTPEDIARLDRSGVEVVIGEELDRFEF